MLLTKYEYRILRYIKRRKTCPPERIRKKFGSGAEEHLRRMREYVDRPLAELENVGYSCMYDGDYFLTDAGFFALSEYKYSLQLKRREAVAIALLSSFLGAFFAYLFTFLQG